MVIRLMNAENRVSFSPFHYEILLCKVYHRDTRNSSFYESTKDPVSSDTFSELCMKSLIEWR